MKIECTKKQMQVIRDACELYGRIQLDQFEMFSELVLTTGIYGCDGKVDGNDMDLAEVLSHILSDFVREMFINKERKAPDNAQIALDMWAKLDNRREGDGFTMGSEPMIKVEP